MALFGGVYLTCGPQAVQAASNRVALVIGNGAYGEEKLNNPENDAEAVGKRLQELGYEVEIARNLNYGSMVTHIRDFYHKRMRQAAVRVFYFAGHGVEYQGHNYLLPVDADIAVPEELPSNSFKLDELRRWLNTLTRGISILILDTCRVRACPGKRCRSVMSTLGLGDEPKSSGTLVAYSTAPGARAGDGTGGSHSTYTSALLELLAVPGMPVEKLFRRLTEEVYRRSSGQQRPEFVDGLLGADVCLNGGPQGQC